MAIPPLGIVQRLVGLVVTQKARLSWTESALRFDWGDGYVDLLCEGVWVNNERFGLCPEDAHMFTSAVNAITSYTGNGSVDVKEGRGFIVIEVVLCSVPDFTHIIFEITDYRLAARERVVPQLNIYMKAHAA